MITRIRGTLVLAALLGLASCEKQADVVTGSVTYNGQPVESGSISFRPVDEGAGFGAQITNGKYTADKVYPGKKKVLIRGVNNAVATKTHEEYERAAAEAAAAGGVPATSGPAEYIPDNAEGNGQTVDVTGGQQTLDFAIKGPPRK